MVAVVGVLAEGQDSQTVAAIAADSHRKFVSETHPLLMETQCSTMSVGMGPLLLYAFQVLQLSKTDCQNLQNHPHLGKFQS